MKIKYLLFILTFLFVSCESITTRYQVNKIPDAHFPVIKGFSKLNTSDYLSDMTMDGRNKLTYFYNKNMLFDSLIIEGVQSNKQLKFDYEYKFRE